MLQHEGVTAKLAVKEKQNFERLAQSVERLDYVANNINQMLLAASGDLESQMHFDAVQIERVLKEVIEDKTIEAHDRFVDLEYKEPANLLPSVEGDVIKRNSCYRYPSCIKISVEICVVFRVLIK